MPDIYTKEVVGQRYSVGMKRDHLIPTIMTDKNGVQRTVYRKPANRQSNNLPAPSAHQLASIPAEQLESQVEDLMVSLVEADSIEWDDIHRSLMYINKWEKAWTTADEHNLSVIQDIATIIDREPFTAEDEAEAWDAISGMIPAKLNRDDDAWRARDKVMNDLAKDLVTRKLASTITHKPAEPVTNPNLNGLEDAQQVAFDRVNYHHADPGRTNYGDVEPFYQETIACIARGDEIPEIMKDRDAHQSLFPKSERLFRCLHPDSPAVNNQFYMAAVFPVNELKKEMERIGLTDVEVDSFYNTREWGNVYTVKTPNGSTRSFSVYEHRNTDSIIINGMENWDKEELPYSGNSKNSFFAEFAPEDHDRAAQALVFYMSQAQQGVLESDENLASKVSRRDWDAILSESIPGFKEWKTKHYGDGYKAPSEETESDIINRLDF